MENIENKEERPAAPVRRRRRMSKMTMIFFVVVCSIIMLLQVAGGAFFCVELYDMNLLPERFLIVIGAVVLVMAVIQIILISQKSGPSFLISALLGLCFIGIVIVGVIYVHKTEETLDTISKSHVTTTLDEVCVAVLADSSYQEILDLKGQSFGVQKTVDRTNTDKTMESIQNLYSDQIQIDEYQGIYDMVQALYDGKDQAIVYNQAYSELIIDSFKTYSEDVRIINTYTYTSTEVMDDIEEEEEISEDEETEIKQEPFIIYMSGIDTYGDIKTKSRSDVNILAVVNPDTAQILLVTTPRDYYVPLALDGAPLDKLTHAGIYGIGCSIRTLEELYDIDINYYMRVNFTGFINIVDALGGVDVKSDYDFTGEAGNYSFKKGMNHVNGKQALCFVRERHTFLEGDAQRAKNQMHMIQAVVDKATSPAILTTYSSVLASVSDAFMTSMSRGQISRLVKLQLAKDIDWNVQTYSTYGEGARRTTYSMGSRKVYVALMDDDSIQEAASLMKAVLAGEIVEVPTSSSDEE